MSFTQGILMALVHKRMSGEGQHVITSQTGATLQFQQATMGPSLHFNGKQRDNGSVGAPKWNSNTYQGSDGKWFIVQPRNFFHMLQFLGREDMVKDERLSTMRLRTKNQDWVVVELEKVFATMPREYWLALFLKEGEPAGPVNTYKEVMDHEQVW